MSNKRTRSYSTNTREATRLLGLLIRKARIHRKMSTRELSERIGISRDLLYRIEKGEPRCEMGATFEAATIVGVPLFDPDSSELESMVRETQDLLALMPKAVHPTKPEVKDDF